MLSASSAFRWLRAAGAAGAPCKRGVAGRSGCCKTSSDAKVIFSAVKTKNPPTGSSGGGLIKSLLLRLLRFLGYPPARQTHVCIAVQQQVQTHTAFADWALTFTANRLHKPAVNHKARFPQRSHCARASASRKLMRPDLRWVGFVGIHMNHPSENLREPAASGLLARFLGCDRTAQSEFLKIHVLQGSALWRKAEIGVLVPASHAERHARVQIVFRGQFARSVHCAYQLVAVFGFLVQQRCRMRRVELKASFQSVGVIREVILRLRNVGPENLEAVGECHAIVLIFLNGGPQLCKYLLRPLFIGRG